MLGDLDLTRLNALALRLIGDLDLLVSDGL